MVREIVFPDLEPWQKDVFDYVTEDTHGRRAAVVSKRQVGKTVVSELILIWFALHSRCVSVMVQPTLAQSRRVFKQMSDMLGMSGIIKNANATLLEITFTNGSLIYLKSAEQKDGLRGLTVSGILIIDEGAFITDECFNILYPTIDANNANFLCLSTPLFAEGEFYRLVNDDGVRTFDWSSYDTSKYLSAERLEYYRKTMPELRFKTEYLAQFVTDGGYLFKRYDTSRGGSSPEVVGVDWGSGTGSDYTWATWLDANGNTVEIWYDNTLSPTQAVDELARRINASGVRKCVVEINSIGAVYYDMLVSRVKCPVVKFNTDNLSKRTAIERLAEALENGKCTVADDSELKVQMSNFGVMKLKTGYTYAAVKGHDDGVMSLAIAYSALGSAQYCISVPKKNNTDKNRNRWRR